jgi:hypothetical protein
MLSNTNIRTFFLKLKSWQLFTLIIFLPLLLSIIYDLFLHWLTNSAEIQINSVWVCTIYIIYFLWVYSIAIYYSGRLNYRPKFLKVSFLTSLIYILYYSFYVFGNNSLLENWASTLRLFALQIIFMIAFFYLIYQTSKMIRKVELSREVSFQDAFADLFCFLFFPFGLWFIQPRVRRLFGKTNTEYKSG